MRFPWSKAKEAEKSSSAPEPGVHEGGSPPTSPSGHPLSSEILVDPEKLPIPESSKTQEDDPITFPSHPAVAPLENTTGDEKQKPTNEITEEALRSGSTATTSSADGEPGEDDDSKYATGLPLHLLTFGLTLSTFVIALDNTIIATAIPRITTVFNSLDDVGWYGSSYLLTTTSLQPSFGKIYTYFNVK